MRTFRTRAGQPINFEGILLNGVDLGVLLAQLGNNTGPNMATSSSTVTVTTRYRANVSGAGYQVNDTLARIQLIDTSTTPPTLTYFWYIERTGAVLANAPDTNNLTMLMQTGLTNTELRASSLPVTVDPNSPDVQALGTPTDTAAAADGTGSITMLAVLRRLLIVINNWNARIPTSLGQKSASASVPVVINSDTWEYSGMKTDPATGKVLVEYRSNGTTRQFRNWTYVVNADSTETSSAGTWTVI